MTPYMLDLLIERAKVAEFKMFRSTAGIAAILANVHRDEKSHPEPFSVMDFIPRHLWPDSVQDGPRLDRQGNVGRTNLKKMPPEKQKDFFFQMMGCGYRPDGSVVTEPQDERILVKQQ